MAQVGTFYDFDRFTYLVDQNATLKCLPRPSVGDQTIETLRTLISRLTVEYNRTETFVPLAQLKELKRFTEIYGSYLTSQYGCNEQGTAPLSLLEKIPSLSTLLKLQNVLSSRIEERRKAIQDYSEINIVRCNQFEEPFSLLGISKVLFNSAFAAPDDDWYVSNLLLLKARVANFLQTRRYPGNYDYFVIECLINIVKIENNLWWVNELGVLNTEEFQKQLFNALLYGTQPQEIITFMYALYGNYDLVEDFIVLAKCLAPDIYNRLAAGNPPVDQALAPPNEKKPKDTSFDHLIPEDFSDPAFLKALPRLLAQIFPKRHRLAPNKLLQRLFQLNSVNDACDFSRTELLKMAYFIEMGCTGQSTHFFSKDAHNIPRSVLYNRDTDDAFVLLKSKGSGLISITTYKKVTKAIQLPRDASLKATVRAQAIFRLRDGPENERLANLEVAKWQYLKDEPCIWPLIFATTYQKPAFPPTVTTISPLADGDIHALPQSCGLDEHLKVFKAVFQGVEAMHLSNHVHGDLKKTNALFALQEMGQLLVGLIDFGFTFNVATEPRATIFNKGYYGSIVCTPPEVFGIKPFDGDYFKADIWALGFMLYCHVFNTIPRWHSMLMHYYYKRSERPVPAYAREVMHALVRSDIEGPLAALRNVAMFRPLTREEKLHTLIFNMMRLDPNERYDISTALAEITTI